MLINSAKLRVVLAALRHCAMEFGDGVPPIYKDVHPAHKKEFAKECIELMDEYLRDARLPNDPDIQQWFKQLALLKGKAH